MSYNQTDSKISNGNASEDVFKHFPMPKTNRGGLDSNYRLLATIQNESLPRVYAKVEQLERLLNEVCIRLTELERGVKR